MSDTPTASPVVLGRWEKPGNLASIAAPADIAARRALCADCEHLAKPEQCGCSAGLCRHPEATHPNITALASAACPVGRWQALSV